MPSVAAWSDARVLAARVRDGDRGAVAAALNLFDDARPSSRARAAEVAALISDVAERPLIGVTGPPGAGKSSLTASLIRLFRRAKMRVGVLAVDPSSPRSGGALLGDRIRMAQHAHDEGVFVRSLASRGELGGLSAEVWPMSLVMLAAFDVVLVETVGIGQSEVDVSRLADTTLYVAQPLSGDTIQFLKAGIMEVPDVFAVNKADLGEPAERTVRELRAALGARGDDGWSVPVLRVSATSGLGVSELEAALAAHFSLLCATGQLDERRKGHQVEWLMKRLREEFGFFGLARLGGSAKVFAELSTARESPFFLHEKMRFELETRLREPK